MRPIRHHARALLTSTFLVLVLSACDPTQPLEPDASTLDMSATIDAGADAGPVVEDDADVRVDPSDEKSPIEQAQPYEEGELPWGDPLISMGSGRVTLEETLLLLHSPGWFPGCEILGAIILYSGPLAETITGDRR